MTILKSLANFSRCTNDDVAPLSIVKPWRQHDFQIEKKCKLGKRIITDS